MYTKQNLIFNVTKIENEINILKWFGKFYYVYQIFDDFLPNNLDNLLYTIDLNTISNSSIKYRSNCDFRYSIVMLINNIIFHYIERKRGRLHIYFFIKQYKTLEV